MSLESVFCNTTYVPVFLLNSQVDGVARYDYLILLPPVLIFTLLNAVFVNNTEEFLWRIIMTAKEGILGILVGMVAFFTNGLTPDLLQAYLIIGLISAVVKPLSEEVYMLLQFAEAVVLFNSTSELLLVFASLDLLIQSFVLCAKFSDDLRSFEEAIAQANRTFSEDTTYVLKKSYLLRSLYNWNTSGPKFELPEPVIAEGETEMLTLLRARAFGDLLLVYVSGFLYLGLPFDRVGDLTGYVVMWYLLAPCFGLVNAAFVYLFIGAVLFTTNFNDFFLCAGPVDSEIVILDGFVGLTYIALAVALWALAMVLGILGISLSVLLCPLTTPLVCIYLHCKGEQQDDRLQSA